MKNRTAWIAAFALLMSAVALAPTSQARNTPEAPFKSSSSEINFDQATAGPEDSMMNIYAWDGVSLTFPVFDFEDEDIEVEVNQFVGATIINTINIDLPSGFVSTGFDADDTYIAVTGDTVCTTAGGDTTDGDGEIDYGWSLSLSANGVTAKGFSCSAADGTVEFRFDVDDVIGEVRTTSLGSYPIKSQFRTAENRKVKTTAWVVETQNLLTLTSSIGG